MNRRKFLNTTTITSAGLTLLPSGLLRAVNSPNNKLNIALIGIWGRGLAHYDALSQENVVALCDVNENRFADALKRFPNAKTYVDWRKCLEQKDLDAVVICTADHTHAFIANWALNRDLHVYCEKPLAITVEQARIVRANWLTKKSKLATQVGMQRHELANFNRVRELITDGAIGELQAAYAWGNRQIRRSGYLPAEGQPPAGLNYDLWLGPSPFHPYNPGYFSGGAGANCLQWNMYPDFGAGQIGDMGSHTMDLVWNAIDATLPTSAEAKGEPFNPEVTPVECESHFEHPANDWRGPIRVSWYQGGVMPRSPNRAVDLKAIDHGAMFKGSKGFLIADFESRMLLPVGDGGDLTYLKHRTPETLLPPVGHFQRQWLDACRDPSRKTACDFEYSSNMIEQMLLGLVAHRVGEKLQYDPVAGKITNIPEANEFLGRKCREGWTMNG
ncbi:MAG: Gfo/Idh/MocA family oxidoreductase [Akkermansiaceae bacterium]|nr:Gfo/Idh/MocA family oxidoreductase [Akkermansiaceae bacterium]MCF7731194.1 Gfo/Idh/MocA family oxidoreductase [Akkermansiaceae bacterium]